MTTEQWNSSPATNLHASAESVGKYAQMEEFMYLGLRMIDGVSRDDFMHSFGDAHRGSVSESFESSAGGGALRAPRRKNIPDTQGTGCQQLCTVAVPV